MKKIGDMLNVVDLNTTRIKTTPVSKLEHVKIEKREKNYIVIPWRAAVDKRINTTAAFLVLSVMCGFTNRHGETWVGQQTIADILGVTRQAIGKQLKRLVELGYLEVTQKAGKNFSARHRVVFKIGQSLEEVKTNTPARLQEEAPPVDKEAARERLANIKNMLKGKGSKQPQELLPDATSEVAPGCNQTGFLAQPNRGSEATSGGCLRVVEGIEGTRWLEE